MNYGEQLATTVDKIFVEQEDDDGLRRHLGASVVGHKCLRQIWFSFRWADREQFDGRMLRLFSRGDREETRFAELLRATGATVWTEDSNGKQFRISALGGHFGGSLDGVAVGLPDLPSHVLKTDPVLLEFKTHNDKSFKDLVKKKVQASKPQHYKQAQTYMHKTGIDYCLYCAVNKNDDTLYFEFFSVDHSVGSYMLNRAESVIFGEGLPARISDNPSWFECTFCSMRGVCFKQTLPMTNCRTCQFSKPEKDGSWSCFKERPEITTQPKQGCSLHWFIPEIC